MTKSPSTKTKAAKAKAPLSYLDTSVLRKIRFGHPAHKSLLVAAIPQPHYVSTYVLMEFFRGVILYFIELYFESAEPKHASFADACTFSSETFSGRDLKTLIAIIILLMQEQGFEPTNPEKKEVCRRKLQDHIFNIAEDLWSFYKNVGIAEENCSKLMNRLRRKDLKERDEHLLEFSQAFRNDKKCRSTCSVNDLLQAKKYGGSYQCIIAGLTAKATPTTTKLAVALTERIASPDDTTCTRCSKIGDVIVAVNCPSTHKIHTLDSSFSTLATCFKRDLETYPSTSAVLKGSN